MDEMSLRGGERGKLMKIRGKLEDQAKLKLKDGNGCRNFLS
jgi:hypothetical protein